MYLYIIAYKRIHNHVTEIVWNVYVFFNVIVGSCIETTPRSLKHPIKMKKKLPCINSIKPCILHQVLLFSLNSCGHQGQICTRDSPVLSSWRIPYVIPLEPLLLVPSLIEIVRSSVK